LFNGELLLKQRFVSLRHRGRCGRRDRMVLRFTTTYPTSAYQV